MCSFPSLCLLTILACGISGDAPSSAEKSIEIAKKKFSIALSENSGKLIVKTQNSKPIEIDFNGGSKISSFQVAEWYNGSGIVLVAEIQSGGEGKEYDYYWATLWVENEGTWRNRQKDGRKFGLVATYPILTRFDKLTIGKLEGHGDGLTVFLIDPIQVPDSKQRLVLTYEHNCAIGPIPGRLRRTFVVGEKLKGFEAP